MGHDELIDMIIETQNTAIRTLLSGNYTGWCVYNSRCLDYLITLKNGIQKSEANHKETIETLKEQLRKAGIEVIEKAEVNE